MGFSVAGHAELTALNSRMLLNRVLLNRAYPLYMCNVMFGYSTGRGGMGVPLMGYCHLHPS